MSAERDMAQHCEAIEDESVSGFRSEWRMSGAPVGPPTPSNTANTPGFTTAPSSFPPRTSPSPRSKSDCLRSTPAPAPELWLHDARMQFPASKRRTTPTAMSTWAVWPQPLVPGPECHGRHEPLGPSARLRTQAKGQILSCCCSLRAWHVRTTATLTTMSRSPPLKGSRTPRPSRPPKTLAGASSSASTQTHTRSQTSFQNPWSSLRLWSD